MSAAVLIIVGISLVATAVNLVLTAVLFRQLGLFVLGTARGANDSGIAVGRRIPKVDLRDARTGAELKISTRAPSIVFFGSTTCSECTRIYPDVMAVQANYDIEVVNLLFGESIADVLTYVERRGVEGQVAMATEEIAHAFDVEVSPFAFVVDEMGVVAGKGLLSGRVHLLKMLEPILDVDTAIFEGEKVS